MAKGTCAAVVCATRAATPWRRHASKTPLASVAVYRRGQVRTLERVAVLKRECFGTADVELKSNWLRIPTERTRRYLVPFGITADRLRQLTAEVKTIMTSGDLTFVASAVDKPAVLAKYSPEKAWYPSAIAYQFLLQRYEKHCARADAVGHLTIDDMSGSSPKHHQWRALLRAHHDLLKKDGCRITKMMFPHIADRPLFASSAQLHLLQLADLLAYNIFRQFREHGDVWDRTDVAKLPVYEPLQPLLPHFMLGEDGTIQGWGIVKWVTRGRASGVWNCKCGAGRSARC